MEECYYSITISLENIKIININESEKSVVEKGNYSLLWIFSQCVSDLVD